MQHVRLVNTIKDFQSILDNFLGVNGTENNGLLSKRSSTSSVRDPGFPPKTQCILYERLNGTYTLTRAFVRSPIPPAQEENNKQCLHVRGMASARKKKHFFRQ